MVSNVELTLRAIVVLVGICLTLLTVPPLPEPSSLINSMSSGRRSRLYSMPISRFADSSLLAVSAVGGGFGAAGVRARPLTFFRFIDRGAKSAMARDQVVREHRNTISERASVGS